jgi:hypothetical protein
VDSGGATSIQKRLSGSLGVSLELSICKTVMTAAEATIAMAEIETLVAIDMHFLPVAAVAVAIVPAPVAADAPVAIVAWTSID